MKYKKAGIRLKIPKLILLRRHRFFVFLSLSLFFDIVQAQHTLQIGNGELANLTPSLGSNIVEWRDGTGTIIKTIDSNGIPINNTDLTLNVSPTANTTYTAKIIDSENLVYNGNFNIIQNTGISSYNYEAPICTGLANNYTITTTPLLFFNSAKYGESGYTFNWFTDISDHTTGTGNMFVANGSTSLNAIVYQSMVNVEAGKTYYVGAWFANIHYIFANPYKMDIYVNGQNIGSLQGSENSNWYRKYAFWTAPTTGSVSIQFKNTQTLDIGNDFAIDDITFSKLIEETFTIEVTENSYSTIKNSVCPSDLPYTWNGKDYYI